MSYLYLALNMKIRELLRREEGQDLSEYALLVALIAVVVMVAVILFGNALLNFFTDLAGEVASWAMPA